MLDENKIFETDKIIDEVLIAEPGFCLPDNFAEQLAEKVGRRFTWEQYLKEFLIYLAVIVGIGGVAAVIALIWYDINWNEWYNFIQQNITVVVGTNILLVFILFADRVLLRYYMHQTSTE